MKALRHTPNAQVSMPPDVNDRLIGEVLNETYRLDSVLGRGTMGTVYQATDLPGRRQVAIKVHAPDASMADPSRADEMKRRFDRETVATLRLNHPNAVKVYDFGTARGELHFLVLELLRGRVLRDLLLDGRGLAPHRAAKIVWQMAQAVSHAHSLDMVHRDLKPENVFICDGFRVDDHVKVMDFGIVRLLDKDDDATKLTKVGHSMGTLAYMSPEQALNQPVSKATDLYAMGVMLFEMLMGHPPFDASNPLMVAVMHIQNEPPPLEVPGMDPEELGAWQRILNRLLAKDPEERLGVAKDLARLLDPMLDPLDKDILENERPTVQARKEKAARRAAAEAKAEAKARLKAREQAVTAMPPPPVWPDQAPMWLWAGVVVAVGTAGAGLALLFAWFRG